ncbi:hypothetical protein [Nocardia arthritidis]|uniref:Uncharacterized protein n=1 Tax=Nocardia arthritidis TaxID=228602 RepID=A0A6G9YK25_9NOCA|nr:hypothetical protein [Nocardia arthritidis]QIS13655.1 hypothetical protein F5544_29050 [Nocardia arthritidis]
MSPKKIDRSDAISMLWSTDGPHTADSITTAANGIAELWRYLAHATLRTDSEVLTDPADVYLVAGTLSAAANSAVQVLRQLHRWAEELVTMPGLTHDSDRSDSELAMTAADLAAGALEESRIEMTLHAKALSTAAAALGHLYIDSDGGE